MNMTKFADIKGFVFDLDGVITDTAQFHTKAWSKLAEQLGVQWSTELQNGLKGLSRMDSLDLVLKTGQKENDYSTAEKEKLAAQKNELYLQFVQTITPADIFPGIKAFLDELNQHGYLMSIASASKNAPTVLAKLELTDYFDHVVDPRTLKHGKPDPEIFIKAAEIIGLKPEQCIGLEDATAGIAGINAANEVSLGVGSPDILTAADMVFEDTNEITLANIEAKMNK